MSRKPDLTIPAPGLSAGRREQVLAELERVLSSPLFRSSRRCHALLRRITEQAVTGEVDSLKERILGVDVFGRLADYDTSQDPVVRASAGETRKKLAQYYQEVGRESETRIELPPGSYLPEFHFIADKPAVAPPPPPTKKTLNRRTRIGIAIAFAIAGLTLAVNFAVTSFRPSDLDAMWDPVVKTPGVVLVSVGLQSAYNLRSAKAQDEIQGIIQAPPGAHPPLVEEDLVLLRDRYVALDDALCMVRLTALLEKYRKPYHIRAERSTSFADLRDNPAVLIGAFDNPWTLRTGGQLRFTFSKDSEQDTGTVHDNQHPENTDWRLSKYWPNWDILVDYAIVTRVVDTTTDRPVIIAAGLTQYGTMGAGELLSNPGYFSEAARRLPKDWQKKNLQIVLSVPVVNRTSGRPRVLATYVW